MKKLGCILLAVTAASLLFGAPSHNFSDPAESAAARNTRAVLMYLPNRLLDLTDVFTWELGFGPGSDLGAQVTAWADFGWESGEYYLVGTTGRRGWLAGSREGSDYAFACWAARDWRYQAAFDAQQSYSWVTDGLTTVRLSDRIFKSQTCDPWAAGVHAGLFVHAAVAVHPVAFWDFLTGWAMIDPEKDDR